jgi:hypothetical protein
MFGSIADWVDGQIGRVSEIYTRHEEAKDRLKLAKEHEQTVRVEAEAKAKTQQILYASLGLMSLALIVMVIKKVIR